MAEDQQQRQHYKFNQPSEKNLSILAPTFFYQQRKEYKIIDAELEWKQGALRNGKCHSQYGETLQTKELLHSLTARIRRDCRVDLPIRGS
ncbi:hypothetical protein KP509_22G025400 [Ceratopteris richardii]|uniref:Uncharacterized protein n=1 Tax=Ceratopteris richardii TaxID=49495 RepID=A0A8T2S4F8_CERRI|nr:hypothetical protein KP509_22G025400 [Ceratopteris richardii]